MHLFINQKLRSLISQIHKFLGIFRLNESTSGYQEESLLEILAQAQKEWNHAKVYFNNVTDPDLIDHAIFYMGATEKKYIYLLKRARQTGLNIEHYNFCD